MTYHSYGTMELWNYGTKMTQIKHGFKKNAMNAPYVDGTWVPTYPGTPDRPGRSCWPLMKSFISSGCTSEKLGKSCAEAASISSFL